MPEFETRFFTMLPPACGRIRLRSWVSDEDLDDLYAKASVFVFLSEYEGFGLTPVEALSAGLPIVVLDTTVAREIYGPAAMYVPRAEPDAIANALERARLVRRYNRKSAFRS